MWPHGPSRPPNLWDQMLAWVEGLDTASMLLAAGLTCALTLFLVAATSRRP